MRQFLASLLIVAMLAAYGHAQTLPVSGSRGGGGGSGTISAGSTNDIGCYTAGTTIGACQTGSATYSSSNSTMFVPALQTIGTGASITLTNVATPSLPNSSTGMMFADSTSLTLNWKNANGATTHTVQTGTCSAGNALISISDAGALVCGSAGSGTPGGASGSIQRNSAGSFAAGSCTDTGSVMTCPTGTLVTAGTSSSSATLVGVVNAQTTSTQCASVANPANLMSYSLATGSLSASGKAVRVTGWGIFGGTNNAKSVALKFGSTTLTTREPVGAVTNLAPWVVRATILSTGTSSQTSIAELSYGPAGNAGGDLSANNLQLATPAEANLTGAVVIQFLGRCDSAATDVIQKGMTVEMLN